MKKTLALILAIVMVFAFATTAFAAEDIVGTVNDDGGIGNGADIDSGATTFDNNGSSANVAIKATQGSVQHRYSVDITYEDMSFDIATGNMVWDVTQLKYVIDDENTDQDAAPAKTSFEVIITNRSDVDVNYSTSINHPYTDGLNIAATAPTGTITSAAVNRQAEIARFNVTLSSDSWSDVRDFYSAKFAAGEDVVVDPETQEASIQVATLTVTVSLANN